MRCTATSICQESSASPNVTTLHDTVRTVFFRLPQSAPAPRFVSLQQQQQPSVLKRREACTSACQHMLHSAAARSPHTCLRSLQIQGRVQQAHAPMGTSSQVHPAPLSAAAAAGHRRCATVRPSPPRVVSHAVVSHAAAHGSNDATATAPPSDVLVSPPLLTSSTAAAGHAGPHTAQLLAL